jgi:hypothetical protein
MTGWRSPSNDGTTSIKGENQHWLLRLPSKIVTFSIFLIFDMNNPYGKNEYDLVLRGKQWKNNCLSRGCPYNHSALSLRVIFHELKGYLK